MAPGVLSRSFRRPGAAGTGRRNRSEQDIHYYVFSSPQGDGAGRGAYPVRVDNVDETAAWRELEAAIDEALWRYAEAVTGVRRETSGEVPGGRLTGIPVHLARLSAARRARQVLRAAEDAAAASAVELGASYPMLADATRTARQTAWKLYRPR